MRRIKPVLPGGLLFVAVLLLALTTVSAHDSVRSHPADS